MSMGVVYRSDLLSPSGYSRAARNHMRALLDVGVDVRGVNHKHDISDAVLDSYWAERMKGVLDNKREYPVLIEHQTPEFYEPHPDTYNIAMLTFECDRIPSTDLQGNPRMNWVRQINRMDEVWTFSSHMVDVFYSSGVRPTMPIHVFPHPIDDGKYSPGDSVEMYNDQRRQIGEDTFVFFSSFQFSARKNPHGLLSAYMSEFRKDEDVILMIKTYSSDFSQASRSVVLQQLNSYKKYVRRPEGLPKVGLMLDAVPEDDIPGVYRGADVFVTATYGEGFGLPVQESMACGVPCIVPRSSSMVDFVTEENGWLVPVREKPVYGMQFPWYEVSMHWWDPDLVEMGRCMRKAFENREMVKDKGRKARETVEKLHTFQKVGTDMKRRLEEIYLQLQ